MSNEMMGHCLFTAMVWHGCSLWKMWSANQSALFKDFCLCAYPDLIQRQGHLWRSLCAFPAFLALASFQQSYNLCFCESLTVDGAPIVDRFQHCCTPSVLAWEMLRRAGFLLAGVGPTHSDHLVTLKCPTWPIPILSLLQSPPLALAAREDSKGTYFFFLFY